MKNAYTQNFNNEESKKNIETARCNYLENIKNHCDSEFIYNPKNDQEVRKNNEFKPLDSDGLAVQIKPQKLTVKLRPRN